MILSWGARSRRNATGAVRCLAKEDQALLVVARYFPPQSVSASWAEATVPASARYVPAGHAEHVLAAVAAIATLYLPAAQITLSSLLRRPA